MRRALLVVSTFMMLGFAVPALAYAGTGNGNGPKDTIHPGKDIHSGKKKVAPPTPAQAAAKSSTVLQLQLTDAWAGRGVKRRSEFNCFSHSSQNPLRRQISGLLA